MTTSKSYLLLSHFLVTAPVRFCTALLLSLMLSATGASAQTVTFAPNTAQTLNAGESLTLRAEAAPANDGPYTYVWTIGSRPFGLTSSGEDTQELTIIAANDVRSASDLQITLRVSSGSSETPVLFTAPIVTVVANRAPTAVIAPVDPSPNADPSLVPPRVDGSTTITLDGSGSYDPDPGETATLTYSWRLVSGGTINLTNANTATASFTTPTAIATEQSLAFQLIVTDTLGASSVSAFTALQVLPLRPNRGPTADAGTNRTVVLGATYTLDGSGSSDPDPGETATLTYSWRQVSGPDILEVGAFTSNEVSPEITIRPGLPVGAILEFELQVTDMPRAGQPSRSSIATVNINVTANPPPTGAVTIDGTPTEGATLTANTSTLDDADGLGDFSYQWFSGSASGQLRTITGATEVTYTLTQAEVGTVITVEVRYTDGGGKDESVTSVATAVVGAPPADTQKTVETINRFLHTRTTLILANQPKLSRRINRLQRGVGTEQLSFATGEITKLKPFEFNFLSLGSGNYKFATSLDQVTRAADHLQVMQGDVGGLTATGMTATHERRRFDVWFEASFNKFNGSAGSGGDFAIAYLGADYLVSPDLLFGALLQYDRLSSNSASENSMIEGKGWMAGPYVTARLQNNLYLDARLAWGKSSNDIRPPDADYTDSFTSTRRLANISLSGEFTQGRWTIRPNASLSYLADKQGAYTNSFGDTIPSQTVSSGQLRIGPNVSTQFLGDNGWLYEPSVTLDAIYSHAGTSGGLDTTPSPQDGWRARLEAGLGMTLSEDAKLSLTGNYDGIGQSGFEAWGLGLNLDMKF